MKDHLSSIILQLATQINHDATVSPKIRHLVRELQGIVLKQQSGKSLSTGSTPSPVQSARRSEMTDIQIIPFQLSPIEKYNVDRHMQIRIQQDNQEDFLFCNQQQQNRIIEKANMNNKQNLRSLLSVIKQEPQQQGSQLKKRTSHNTFRNNKRKNKRFNYLAMAQDSYIFRPY